MSEARKVFECFADYYCLTKPLTKDFLAEVAKEVEATMEGRELISTALIPLYFEAQPMTADRLLRFVAIAAYMFSKYIEALDITNSRTVLNSLWCFVGLHPLEIHALYERIVDPPRLKCARMVTVKEEEED